MGYDVPTLRQRNRFETWRERLLCLSPISRADLWEAQKKADPGPKVRPLGLSILVWGGKSPLLPGVDSTLLHRPSNTWEQGRGPVSLFGSPDSVPASLRNRRESEFPYLTRWKMPTQKSKAMRSIKPSLSALQVCKSHLAHWPDPLANGCCQPRRQPEWGWQMTATQGLGARATLPTICHVPFHSLASSGRALPFSQAPQDSSPPQLHAKKQKAVTDAHWRPWHGVKGYKPVPAGRGAAVGRSRAASLDPGNQGKNVALGGVPKSQSLSRMELSQCSTSTPAPILQWGKLRLNITHSSVANWDAQAWCPDPWLRPLLTKRLSTMGNSQPIEMDMTVVSKSWGCFED